MTFEKIFERVMKVSGRRALYAERTASAKALRWVQGIAMRVVWLRQSKQRESKLGVSRPVGVGLCRLL